MNLNELKEILKREKNLFKDRDEILYLKEDLKIKKDKIQDEIRNAYEKKQRYLEYKDEKKQELIEKISILSVVSVLGYSPLNDISSPFVSALLTSSAILYFGGLLACSYKFDLDEYKADKENYLDSDEIKILEDSYDALRNDINNINVELSNNSSLLTSIYNQLNQEEEPKKLVKTK